MHIGNHTIITIIDFLLTPISRKIVYRSVVLVGPCRNAGTWGAGWVGSAARSAGRALGLASLTPACNRVAKSGRLSCKFLLLHDSRRLGLVVDLGER